MEWNGRRESGIDSEPGARRQARRVSLHTPRWKSRTGGFRTPAAGGSDR